MTDQQHNGGRTYADCGAPLDAPVTVPRPVLDALIWLTARYGEPIIDPVAYVWRIHDNAPDDPGPDGEDVAELRLDPPRVDVHGSGDEAFTVMGYCLFHGLPVRPETEHHYARGGAASGDAVDRPADAEGRA